MCVRMYMCVHTHYKYDNRFECVAELRGVVCAASMLI